MFLTFANFFTIIFFTIFDDFSYLVNYASAKFAKFKGYDMRKRVKCLKTYKT